MRDPERIPRVLALLAKRWSESPDLRLCQIIGNITGPINPYNVEDDVIEDGLSKEPGTFGVGGKARLTAMVEDVKKEFANSNDRNSIFVGATEISLNKDGTVDEIFVRVDGNCVFHMEQMDDNFYWAAAYNDVGGNLQSLHMDFISQKDIVAKPRTLKPE